jgi:MerR family transcriptional regulator, light-induced transcriptional regulator
MERKGEVEIRGVRYPSMGLEEDHYAKSQYRASLTRVESRRRNVRLSDVVAHDIVPRLRLIHHGMSSCVDCAIEKPSFDEIVEFASLTMLPDNDAAFLYFDELKTKKFSLQTLFVHLLAPAARYLAEQLDQDRCDLVDFTMGVARLRQLLLVFGSADEMARGGVAHRALVMAMPAQKHLFERDLVATLMRGAGWETSVSSWCASKDAGALVFRQWFGVFYLMVEGDDDLGAAAAIVKTVRRASSNVLIRIMVGGLIFAKDTGLVAQIGADAAAPDALSAVILARKLVAGTDVD